MQLAATRNPAASEDTRRDKVAAILDQHPSITTLSDLQAAVPRLMQQLGEQPKPTPAAAAPGAA